jgi:hypothetical protein
LQSGLADRHIASAHNAVNLRVGAFDHQIIKLSHLGSIQLRPAARASARESGVVAAIALQLQLFTCETL